MFKANLFREKATRSELVKDGVIAGVAEVLYIGLTVVFSLIAESTFPSDGTVIITSALAFLVLLVLSAAVSATLIFGWPLYYALKGRYAEAFAILLVTIGTLLAIFFGLVVWSLLIAITL